MNNCTQADAASSDISVSTTMAACRTQDDTRHGSSGRTVRRTYATAIARMLHLQLSVLRSACVVLSLSGKWV